MKKLNPVLLIISTAVACNNSPQENVQRNTGNSTTAISSPSKKDLSFDTTVKTIHVLVALCDNKYQGIVPVPAKIGNGQDPANNLYWGCAGGIRTYFKNSKHWQLIKQYKIDETRLERVVFKHKRHNYYLVADAYDGRLIKECTVDFLKSCSGQLKDTLMLRDKIIGINGNGNLVAYIGHNGLMDFSVTEDFSNTDNKTRDAIMLACISKHYFWGYIQSAGARPLLWSTGLMSPEAYTLHDALESYITQQPAETIRTSAANAYSRYQRCSIKASKKLLVSGF